MDNNLILICDSYKVSHWDLLPDNTTETTFYQEARVGSKFDTIVPFYLQALLQKYFVGVVITQDMIEEANELFADHFGDSSVFNRAGWEYIVKHHGGKLPVSIKAVPEGLPVPVGNALLQITSTDPKCSWLPGYLETILCQLWHPTAVASQGRAIKKIVAYWLEKTGGDMNFLPFMIHDFSARGVECPEANEMGCSAHLVNFMGTDTILALHTMKKYYGAKCAGYSIRATEHSITTINKREGEEDFYRKVITKYPNGLVAMVMDSYDIDNAFQVIIPKLKDLVLARTGRVVFRPDSGDPSEMVIKVHNYLGDIFGYTVNEKGYKVLHPKVGVIQGDGMDFNSIGMVLENLANAGWSCSNFAMGVGAGLVQKLNRDTLRFAIKLNHAVVDGIGRDVQKMPKTDPTKASKSGKVKVIAGANGFETVSENASGEDVMVEVFRDGVMLQTWTLDEIRARATI